MGGYVVVLATQLELLRSVRRSSNRAQSQTQYEKPSRHSESIGGNAVNRWKQLSNNEGIIGRRKCQYLIQEGSLIEQTHLDEVGLAEEHALQLAEVEQRQLAVTLLQAQGKGLQSGHAKLLVQRNLRPRPSSVLLVDYCKGSLQLTLHLAQERW